ncbi:MAG: hypothetical protein V7785_14290, partial [Bermanella sp.]
MQAFLIFLTLLTFCNISIGSPLTVRHIKPVSSEDTRNEYFVSLLKLSLDKTKNLGSYKLAPAGNKMVQRRAIANLSQGISIDILWTMTSEEREETLLPVRIPLLKGLLGHRIFIIKKEDENRFSKIESINELKSLSAGQGKGWPDTDILKYNGFKVVESPTYISLFKMLESDRFDYFPRGVNEPWSEVMQHQDKNLVVEKTLLIQYPAPIYFFFKKSNSALASRIEKGLWLAIEDGSFDKLELD